MKITRFTPVALAACAFLTLGCQDSTTYETRKPVLDDPSTMEDEDSTTFDSMDESAEEAADDVADAVTPDDRVADVDTPLGDVTVDEDPATGRTDVDVDSDRADVDVDSEE